MIVEKETIGDKHVVLYLINSDAIYSHAISLYFSLNLF